MANTRPARNASKKAAPTEDVASDTKGKKPCPRLYHRKSRKGCQRCRARRVKCNEVHPVCGNCERHQVTCHYDRQEPDGEPAKPGNGNAGKPSPSSEGGDSSMDNKFGLLESRDRRLLELKLMHHYSTDTYSTLLGATKSDVTYLFKSRLPALALTNDALLYSLYAVTSLHLATSDSTDAYAMDAHLTYLDLALHAHSQEITSLNPGNADAACATSSLLRIANFALLRDRPTRPYEPPLQWLKMTHEAAQVFMQASKWIEHDEDSLTIRILTRSPAMTPNNKDLFKASNRESLMYLLDFNTEQSAFECNDVDVRLAYETALSLLGSVQLAIVAGEETAVDITRRLIVWPILVPRRFISLVEELQPRALVILAHYFALVANFRDIWWVQDTGKREVSGIQSVLPDEWQQLMTVPVQTTNTEYQD